jgi:glycosyltransferase involved in cell wall biosynthesis
VSIPPRVSVFIPLHNGEPYLGAAIDSVLGQTLRDLELVIVENGSVDGSLQTARRAAARDRRVRIVEHPRPLGIVGAGNAGVAAATAPLVARQDQDDLSDPHRLERQVAALERDRSAVAVGTLCDCVDGTGRRVRPRDRWRLVGRSPLPPFPHGSLCVRRDVFNRVGGYRDGTYRWEDVDLLLRLAREGRVLVLPEALYRYRYHERSLTSTAEPGSDASATLMWRCIEASRRGADWSELLGAPDGAAPPARVAARTSRHQDGVRLWSGAPLDDEAPAPTALLRARRAWQRASPATLRAALFAGIVARDRVAAVLVPRNRAVAWRPR